MSLYKRSSSTKCVFLATSERTLTQAALRFILDEPAISVVIPGIKTVAQAVENLAASTLPALTAEGHALLHKIIAEAMEELF
jgi:aryl-alcohol dehydrogenase-like predicted oxidoreductase